MSNSGVIRTHGLDGAPRLSFDPARRRIEPADVAFAQANKHRMGWQTMANIRAVNMVDLRRHCELGYAVANPAPVAPAASKPKSPPPPARKAPPPLDPVRVLRAIRRGAASHDDLAELLSITPGHAKRATADLKARGWLAGYAGSLSGWVITKAGDAAIWNARP